jgi:predicted MFS family arabinose efflux permease
MPRPLWLLALGSFAVGTDAFVIAGLLPDVAGDLGVSVARTGLLVTAFALAYALGGPPLAVATSGAGRRTVLAAALLAFSGANALGALAPSYGWLMAARVLAALGAALFMPSASALAVSLVDEARRGRALAVVYGGLTLATALGVPLGTAVAAALGWRGTLWLVAFLGALSAAGARAFLPALPGAPTASLRQRAAVAARPAVLSTLALTVLILASGFTVYTYIAPVLAGATGAHGAGLSLLLLGWGLAAATGNAIGGRFTDRRGPVPVLGVALMVLASVFTALSAGAVQGVVAAVIWLILWGTAAWMTVPALQHRVVGASPDLPAVALSLNSSAIYLGVATGGALGAVLQAGGTGRIGAGALALDLCGLSLLGVLAVRARALTTAGR